MIATLVLGLIAFALLGASFITTHRARRHSAKFDAQERAFEAVLAQHPDGPPNEEVAATAMAHIVEAVTASDRALELYDTAIRLGICALAGFGFYALVITLTDGWIWAVVYGCSTALGVLSTRLLKRRASR